MPTIYKFTLIEQNLKIVALLYYVVNCSCKPHTGIVMVITLSIVVEFLRALQHSIIVKTIKSTIGWYLVAMHTKP